MKRRQKTILISLIVIILLACVGPFLVPVPPLEGTMTESALADPDSKFIAVNGLTVHYKEQGSGEQTFILLHGFGASVYSWHAVIGEFAMLGRVVAYDRPAFGLTSRPMPEEWQDGVNPYSMESNVELLRALMDELNIKKAVLVGNSAGGGVAVAFALRYPERTESLVLVDPGVGGGSGGQIPAWVLPVMQTPQMRHLGLLLVRRISTSGDDTIRMAWSDPSKVTDETIAGYRKPLQSNNWDRALYEFSFAPAHPELRPQLPKLNLPVLVIAGQDDHIIPLDYIVAVAGEIPGAQLVVMPGCGHVPHEECAPAFMENVIAFLRTVTQ
jgi:pimeloyl-ACP methyl ester carboxylesterase